MANYIAAANTVDIGCSRESSCFSLKLPQAAPGLCRLLFNEIVSI